MSGLLSIRYQGGKSANKPIGRWVASHLPYDRYYVEPFAGMLGVLLQRRPSRIEIVNDLDGNVTNWWQVVRDNPTELRRWIELTPIGRRTFQDSREVLYKTDDKVARAGAFAYLLTNSFLGTGATFAYPFGQGVSPWESLPRRIHPLAARLHNVKLESLDALDMLSRVKDIENAVVYCDPPYPGTSAPGLNTQKLPAFDHAAMCEILVDAKARVGVSGLDSSEYELPGWHQTEFDANDAKSRDASRRVEMLWTNYPTCNSLF